MLDRLLISSSARAIDPQFRNVTLLLHGDGSNGGQNNTFIDSSSNNFTVTRNGNTTQGSFSPYGTRWSNYFDGSGDFLSAPSNAAFDLGGGNFTVECWFNANSFAANAALISRYTYTSSGFGWIIQTRGPNTIRFVWGNDNIFDCTVPTMSAGTWYHVAGVRVGNTVTIYLNGVQAGQNTGVTNFSDASSTTLQIGRTHTITDDFPGYISNVRVVKGTAVYTSNFTVPTAPLTAITNTSLLTCQSNRFRDASTNNFAITSNGDVRVTPFSPYAPTAPYSAAANGGSAYFDNNGDYLSVPASSNLSFGLNNFTIEAWVYGSGSFSTDPICESRASNLSTGGYAFLVTSSGNLNVYTAGGFVGASTGTISPGSWNHVALVRSGVGVNQTTYYINGVASGTITLSSTLTDPATNETKIGGSTTVGENWGGFISNLRIVNGTAVYTSSFTPPTSPVTAISGTSLLLNGTNAAIFDSAADNNLETIGNAQVSTVQSKFGGSSVYFDGTGDYLVVPNNTELQMGSGNFTIEFWWYPLSNSGYQTPIEKGYTNSGGLILQTEGDGKILVYASGAAVITASTAVTLNTWNHMALVRNGTSLVLYLNGVSVGSATNSTNFNSTGLMGIGANVSGGGAGGYPINGYIDDLRITKGVARYTSNFTPPTAPFPDQ